MGHSIKTSRAARLMALAVCTHLVLSLSAGSLPAWRIAAGDEIVPDELIVVYRDDAVVGPGRRVGVKQMWHGEASPARVIALHQQLQVQVKSRFRVIPAEVIKLSAGDSLSAAAVRYQQHPDVVAVYPNRIYRPNAHIPDDPLWSEQWGMEMIRVAEAWGNSPVLNTATVVVAVIDTGIYMEHPDLKDIIWTNPNPGNLNIGNRPLIDDIHGWDFWDNDNDPSDQDGHGTHVAGTIGAIRDNAIGVAGFGPHIRIMPVRGLDDYGTSESLGHSIEYVALMSDHVKLSNNSWGGSGEDEFIAQMIELSRDAGQLFVAAAGNDSLNIDVAYYHPASMPHDNIITVASVNEHDRLSDFSNYGVTSVDIAAPGGTLSPAGGREIISTWHVEQGTNGYYNSISGTSMAAPHVTGAAAYLWGLRPSATYKEIIDALLEGAVVNPSLHDSVKGARRLDLPGAIGALAYSRFQPDKFYGDPANGFPISSGGLAVSTLASVWLDDHMVEVTIDGDEGVWLEVVNAPGMLASGDSEELIVRIDPNAPGFPTEPGVYENTVTITLIPAGADEEEVTPITLVRSIKFKLTKNYFLQSAPFNWVEPLGEPLSRPGLTTEPLVLGTNLNVVYYDVPYGALYPRANGVVFFDAPDVELPSRNAALPVARTPTPALFPNWMPTDAARGKVYAHETTVEGRNAIVVTWLNMSHLDDTAAGYDYQVLIFDAADGENSEIRYQYRTAAQGSLTFGMGRRSTVGLQSEDNFLAAHYTVNGTWRTAPGSEYDTSPGLVDNTPLELADGQTLRWTWAARDTDVAPPTATIEPIRYQADAIYYEIRFNEIVFDLTADDLFIDSPIASLESGAIIGGGERFIVTIFNPDELYGSVGLQLPVHSVYDLAGNWNVLPMVAEPAAIPYRANHFSDDFERGPGLWQASAHGGTTDFTTGGWEFGTPWPAVADGPAAAFSGTNCWGTFLGAADWSSDNGYPNGWYPGGSAYAMNARLESPRAVVGADPVVSFQAFWSFGSATASIMVLPKIGDPILLGTLTGSSAGEWQRLTYHLPSAMVQREIAIRIEVVSPYGDTGAGLYIDDFHLYSTTPPGLYFIHFVPDSVAVPSSTTIGAVAYNTQPDTAAHVSGVFTVPVAGVAVAPDEQVYFGSIPSGGMATSDVPVTVAAGDYQSPDVPVQANSYVNGSFNQTSQPLLTLDPAAPPATSYLIATTGVRGVRDWLDRPLSGDGSAASAGYQIIWVGPNGVIDPPEADGRPGGDDIVLFSTGRGLPVERFGAIETPADSGRFKRAFSHSLPVGATLYARAWDGPSIDRSVVYGDSGLRQLLTAEPGETVNFGTWSVAVPFQYNRDNNGDGIPDGYVVTHPELGLDPREMPDPSAYPLSLLDVTLCSRADYRPIRVNSFNDKIYILYISQSDKGGVVEVRDLSLKNLEQSVRYGNGTENPLLAVSGMAIDRANSKLYVSENSSLRRIYRYAIAGDGQLAYEATHTVTHKLLDITAGSDGSIYVADNGTSIKGYTPLMASGPTALLNSGGVATTDRITLFGDNLYRTFFDSMYSIHQVQLWSLAGGNLQQVFGEPYRMPQPKGEGYLTGPAKVWEGMGGLLYVADRTNNRLQLFDPDGSYVAMWPVGSPPPATDRLGWFDLPTDLCVVNDPYGDHAIYVADEKNNRVQRLAVCLDRDGDGMDDIWELQHGLDPTDPSDGALDNDGDGLSNLGEYRMRRNPNDADTDGDGRSDSFDLYEHPEEGATGDEPARVVNLVATVAEDGASVTIVVTYDKAAPLNDPVLLALQGGAYLAPDATEIDGANATYLYTVRPGDAGWVTVVVTGPWQDPPRYTAVDAFELGTPASAELLTFTALPEISGAGTNVQLTATFSEAVSDAVITIKMADNTTVQAATTMSPAGGTIPDAIWVYGFLPPLNQPDCWYIASLDSTALTAGGAQPTAAFAVIDPRIIDFTAPPPAITWNALTGIVYRIESRDHLANGSWNTLLSTNRIGTDAVAPLTVLPPDPIPNVHRFYRIVAP